MVFFIQSKKIRHFRFCALSLIFCIIVLVESAVFAENVVVVGGDLKKSVIVSSRKINSWKTDDSRVFVCLNDVRIERGDVKILADECVCWFYEDKALQSDEAVVDAYFSGNVTMLNDDNDKVEKHDQLFLRLSTTTGVVFEGVKEGVRQFEDEQVTTLLNRAKVVKRDANQSFRSSSHGGDKDQLFSIPESDQTISIFADEVDSWVENGTRIITAIGNVKLKRGDIMLDADNVILKFDESDGAGLAFDNREFEEIYAEGNVTLRNKDDVQLADKIFVNYKEGKGLLINGEINIPVGKKGFLGEGSKESENVDGELEGKGLVAHIKGDEIKFSGKGQYEIQNGEFTSCGFNHPHFKFKSSKIRVIRTEGQSVISMAGNKLYWGSRPIMYWPYVSFDVRSKANVLQDWEIGSSSRYGAFLTTDWNLFNLGFAPNLAKWSDLMVSLDFLEKRGQGVGTNFDYKKDNFSGILDSYYIKDREDEELNDVEVEGEDRWRVSWRHRQQLPYNMRLDLEVNHLSDDTFLREFYEQIYKVEKDEETVLYLRQLEDTHSATFLIKKQLNSFDTVVDAGKMDRVAERLPELSYKVIGEPLLFGALNYTTENTLTYFDRVFSSDEVGIGNNNPDPESTLRFDTNTEISAPFKMSIVKVKPFMRGRLIGYSDSVDDKSDPENLDNSGSALERIVGTLGVDMSATMWRTYSVYNKLFNINRIRHVMTPELRYSANPFVTKDPGEVTKYDSVDTLNDSQWLLLGFKNKFQTKRGTRGNEKITDLVYFDVELNLFVGDEAEGSSFNNEVVYNAKREDFIQFDFRANISDHVALVSERNEYNLETKTFDSFNAGVAVTYDNRFKGFLGQRFVEGVSSSLLFSTDYTLSDKWEVVFFEQFDFRSRPNDEDEDFDEDRKRGKNLKTKLVLTRFFHEWMGSLTAEFNPVRDETITRFDIFPNF